MANELIHTSAGTTLTQAEFEAVGLHVCNSQATGDLIYASSSSQLSRLAITDSRLLISSGGVPTWSATLPAVTLAGTITGGSQVINTIGHIGVMTASSATRGIGYTETFTNPAADYYGFYSRPLGIATSAPNAKSMIAFYCEADIYQGNTQTWTKAAPGAAVGVHGKVTVEAPGTVTAISSLAASCEVSSSAVVTSRYGLYVENAIGNATLTNQYGIYIADLTKGSSLDYGIYIAGADTYAIYVAADGIYAGGGVDTNSVYKVSATQVVGARVVDARCDDAINSGDATTDGVIDALRDAMITHGLISAA